MITGTITSCLKTSTSICSIKLTFPGGSRSTDSVRDAGISAVSRLSVCRVVMRHRIPSRPARTFSSAFALTALAMGTRNTAVRKLAIPDLTTTVLTLTITGIGADSSFANGNNPRLARRVESVAACSWARHWVLWSYITRSQRSCGLRPQFPPCAVWCYSAPRSGNAMIVIRSREPEFARSSCNRLGHLRSCNPAFASRIGTLSLTFHIHLSPRSSAILSSGVSPKLDEIVFLATLNESTLLCSR